MPKPEDEIKEDELLEDEDLEIEEDDEELEIDLDDDGDDDEEAKRAEKDRNKAFAAMRIENKQLKDSVDALSQQVKSINKPAAPAAPAVPGLPKTDEEWDDLAEKDWKKAVDLRSIQNAQNILKNQQLAIKAKSTLETSKQKVLEIHPELNDDTTEKSKIFLNILNENPDYLTQPRGPIYAMRDMEEYMENTLGYKKKDIRSAERKGAEREASRQNRIVLNKGSGRTSASTSNKIVLGKDELDFCKFQGIDPKEYARNKKKLSKSKTDEVTT